MATLRELFVKVGVKVDDKQLQSLDSGLQKVKKSAMLVGGALVGMGAALLAVTKNAADYADSIDDTSMRLGVARDELQKLQYAMQLSGGDTKLLTTGLTRLTDRVKLLGQGNKEAIKTFQGIGIETKKADGSFKNSNEILLEMADVFQSMPDGIKKTELAMKAIGPEAGPRLIPLLNAGRAGIEAMGKEAEDLGLIMDDASIKAGSNFNDSLDALKGIFGGLARTVGAQLFPVMTELINSIKGLILENRELIKTNLTSFMQGLVTVVTVAKSVITSVAGAVGFLTSRVGGLIPVLKILGGLFLLYQTGQLAMGIFQIAKGFMLLRKAITLANLSALAIPILIGLAVAAVALIIDDLFAFISGKPSFLGYLIANKDEILQSIEDFLSTTLSTLLTFLGVSEEKVAGYTNTFRALFQGAVEAVAYLYEWLGEMFDANLAVMVNLLNGDFRAAFFSFEDTFTAFFKPLRDGWELFYSWFKEQLSSFNDYIIGVFSGIYEKTVGKLQAGLNSVKGFFGFGDTESQEALAQAPQNFEAATKSIAESNNISNISSQTRNTSLQSTTNMSPTINISLGGGGAAGAGDAQNIADAIGQELTKIAQTVSRNQQPAFAD